MNTENANLTKAQLIKALKNGTVIIAAQRGLIIEFVYKKSEQRGALLDSKGAIKRFRTDTEGWRTLNHIYNAAGKGSPF